MILLGIVLEHLGSVSRWIDGEGVKKDINEAIRIYRLAVEQGNAFGQSNLGLCYEQGAGVTRDANEAVKWYQKAAEQGHQKSQDKVKSGLQPQPETSKSRILSFFRN